MSHVRFNENLMEDREKSDHSLGLRLVYPVLQYRRERPSLLDLLADWFRINFWRVVGLYISFGRLGQCTWVLKVSVLETGHTRHCSISGSDPLRQPYRLCHGCCRPVVKHQPLEWKLCTRPQCDFISNIMFLKKTSWWCKQTTSTRVHRESFMSSISRSKRNHARPDTLCKSLSDRSALGHSNIPSFQASSPSTFHALCHLKTKTGFLPHKTDGCFRERISEALSVVQIYDHH